MTYKSQWRRSLMAAGVACCLLATWRTSAYGEQVRANRPPAEVGSVHQGSYRFIFFWKTDDQETRAMLRVFHDATDEAPVSINKLVVDVRAPSSADVVKEFGVSRAPMPLVLAVAPNGAVTKGFPIRFTKEQVLQGIVSPATAKCMKALQDKKMVLLVVQNERTQFREVAYRGADGVRRDARFAKAAEIVTVDPADSAEASFLQSLRVNPRTEQAVTVVLAPPGKPIATFTGAVTTEQIIAKVTAARSGCCPGGQCGPGGCCPGGQCNR